MATGLLGINPYGQGLALDISSKPTQEYVQHEQHEQAKREALDKYLMDYEKSINPAGMRKQEADQFMNQLAQTKQYYLQNRDAILNPSKYGYDKQSQLMSNYKGMLNLIDQSKQAAAQDKAAAAHYNQATNMGLGVPDGYLEAIRRSHLPVNDPNYVPVDPTQWNFYKKFDDQKFVKDTYGGIKPNENIVRTASNPNAPGKLIETYKYSLDPEDKRTIASRAVAHYDNDTGTKKYVDDLYKSGQYMGLQNEYKQLFPNEDIRNATPRKVAAALALSLGDIDREKTRSASDELALMRMRNAYTRGNIAYRESFKNNNPVSDNSNILTDLVNEASKTIKPVYNRDTKQNENWYVVPMTKTVQDQFIAPIKVDVKNTKGEVVGQKIVQKAVDNVLYNPRTKEFIGYYQTLDAEGNPTKNFEQKVLNPRDIAQNYLKGVTTTKEREAAIKSALEGLSGKSSTQQPQTKAPSTGGKKKVISGF
jgi:hypothetical protein